ncbi:MAG: CBS domain-containing protein [Deltaproteobacteria bacterium]|nr:CBS domain-containing protein [Deltaproteobacteria bacterium]
MMGALEREVARLHAELDAALGRAAEVFGADAPSAREQTPSAARSAAEEHKPSHIQLDLTVGDVMTRDVRTVGRNDRLAKASEQMRSGELRHLVVLDEDGNVAGVLSDRDLAFNALSWSLGQSEHAHEQALDHFTVKETMKADVVSIDSSAPLEEAARRMSREQIGCLPVVDSDELVGIIAASDFLQLFS